jgi:hypothetical protein
MPNQKPTKKVAIVRDNFTKEIVDALIVEDFNTKDTNLSSIFLTKWPPFTYSFETVIGNDLNSFFLSEDIQVIRSLAELNQQGLNTAKPKSFYVKGYIPKSNKTEKLKDLKKYRDILSRCEERSLNCFISICGEANPKVYDKALFSALEQLSNNNGSIDIIAGPVIIASKDNNNLKNKSERSILPKLANLKNSTIYYSKTRQSLHFRIGGGKYLYVEIPHSPAKEERHGWFYDQDQQAIDRFRKIFENTSKSDSVKYSKKPDEDFFFLTEPELDNIGRIIGEEVVQHHGKPFNQYTKEDFYRLIDKKKIQIS